MQLPVRGRISVDTDRDHVGITLGITGWLVRWLLGLGGAISGVLFVAAWLFGIGGTADWPQGWAFMVSWSANVLISCVVSSTEVVVERVWPFKDMAHLDRGDRAFIVFLAPVVLAWMLVVPLEAKRYGWSTPPPDAVAFVGFLLVNVGWAFMTLAVRQNRFASAVVKVQADRHHEVVDWGVYKIVRHPMYLGASLLAIGAPLLLGSYLAIGLSLVGIVGLTRRIRVEERVLRAGLPGYDAYTARVRHRLVPYLW